MLRIRFHGRGGQGMKTASRVLGSAAFHAGFIVQDSPIYGAERRGAPVAAFVRLSHEPIHERGLISWPDLVVVADDTLLVDVAAQPLVDTKAETVVVVNSTRTDGQLRAEHTISPARLLVADFTALAREHTKSLVGASTALGVVAARLVGLTFTDVETSLALELAGHMTPAQRESNITLARATWAEVEAWQPLVEAKEPLTGESSPVVDVTFDPPRVAAPSIYALGNSPERQTGNWRQFRPVFHEERCTRCWVCFVRCPEAAITLDDQDYPRVNYEECKGCLLCVHECPVHAYTVEKEVR
ncbi:MAG: 2-oxoacid:acceptor oxidoreductase family protein [Candidatus Binatia bacterium]